MSYISALVIQTTDEILINETTGEVGQTQQIATPNSGGQLDGDFWATPVTGFGVIGTGFNYVPTQPGSSSDKPDVQSFHVFRLINQSQAGNVYVLGTSTQYNTVSKEVECCGTTSPAPVMPTSADLPIIAACQTLCNQDATSGLYVGVFAAPTPDTGTYAANGYFNGVALPQVTAATVALLNTALNANASWNSTSIGTWTNPSGATLIVTQGVNAPGTDILCMKITVG